VTVETPDAVVETPKTPKPGFYRDIDFDTYAGWDAANASTLNLFAKTPAHVRHNLDTGGKKRTKSLDLGWLFHVLMLEPERFKKDFVVPPKVDGRTKDGKATRAKFQAEHENAELVDIDTFSKVKAMANSLTTHPTAAEFLSGRGHNELSLLWVDRETEVLCKARIDRVGYENEWPVVGDLKTARDASRFAMEKAIASYGYHVQAAHYLAGLEALSPIPDGNPFRRFHFFVVEHEPPYCAAVYEITDEALEEGLQKRDRYLRKWRECNETNNWHGYPLGVEYVSLPPWAFKHYEDIS